MSYKINPLQNPEFEFHRILKEKAEKTISLLNDESVAFDVKVHDFRTNIKKMRAVLKLMRYNLGDEVYRHENSFYRELQNELSPVRDSYIRQYTLTSLLPKASRSLNVRLFDRYFAELNSRYEAVRKEYISGDIIGKVKNGLEEHTAKISLLTLEDDGIDTAGRGLKKIYKQALRAMETAMKESTPENMHEWRKKTKYLWYQVKMLKLIWPGIMGSLGKEIHQLSDYLGNEHDLSILTETLNDKKYQGDSMVHSVKTFALDRKEDLNYEAVILGPKVFYESPGRFSKRIISYWKVSLGDHST